MKYWNSSLKRFSLLILITISIVFIQSTYHSKTNAQSSLGQDKQNELVTLSGNIDKAIQPDRLRGKPNPQQRLEELILVLNVNNRVEFDQLLADQQDPNSPLYHKWLTPAEFGARFGATDLQLAMITDWMTSNGLTIDRVEQGRTSLTFSGTVEQLEKAFHTTLNNYALDENLVIANATEPKIPTRIAEAVNGVIGLNGFHKYNFHHTPVKQVNADKPQAGKVHPNYNGPSGKLIGPADFNVLYNINPLYTNNLDGTGQTIAIVARCDFKLSDVQTFRSTFGLPAKDPVKVFVTTNPGITSTGEEIEVLLDSEWSGAVAKNATVKVCIGQSTQTTDGVDASIQYIINNNVAPVVSISFGLCETDLGSSGNLFYNNLFAQGAAQGQSIFVSSGDSGAAACFNAQGSPIGPAGVNGLSSTPYNVAVGGTSLQGAQFNASGLLTGITSETTWNDSPGGGSTGGGASSIYAKPSWQVAPGVLADSKRDLPDVSFMGSANNIGYYIYQSDLGGLIGIGGTSASAPSMAGLMSIIVQNSGQQGNPNPTFYQLGNAQYNGTGPAVYRDIKTGNNSYAGVTGFSAGTGYDATTGLGVPDGFALVTNWGGSVQVNPPSISSFTPSLGVIGSTVVITGSNFTNASAVKFNTTNATAFTVNSDTQITANVPTGATTGNITVTTSGGSSVSTSAFTVVIPPKITSFSPLQGVAGTNVNINGSNFTGTTDVQFNGTSAASFTVNSATSISAVVPGNATTGKITVVKPGASVQSANTFKILPKITGFTPGSGPAGTAVTITGFNLSVNGAAPTVKFSNVIASVQSFSPTQVVAIVPNTAASGSITVATTDGTATSPTTFTVAKPPTITSFTPLSFPSGAKVTISGTNLATVTSVSFNGVSASFTVSGATLLATVPVGATSGKIMVSNSVGSATSTSNYTIVKGIGSFSPTSGRVGSQVTIIGTGFTGATVVRFGAISATNFTVVSNNQINVTVPTKAITGRISIVTPTGTLSSTTSFTVTP